jgi:hypothetical protein
MAESNRLNFLGCYIGHNRTGKTSVAVLFAEAWRKRYPEGTIMTFDPQEKFKHISDFRLLPSDPERGSKMLNLRDALLIIDDYKAFHHKNIPEPWLLDLMHYRNAYNIDIIVITHSPALIINYLTYYITHYFVFYTETQVGSWEKKIPTYNLCQNASLYVNKYVKINGKGEYPVFPHIVVDTLESKLTAQNIEL